MALHLVLRSGRGVGETYNIGGETEKNIEVVELICDILDNLVSLVPVRIETRFRLFQIGLAMTRGMR